MNKGFLSFLGAFVFSFLSAFSFFNWDLNPRAPASLGQDPILDLAPDQTASTANAELTQKIITKIDSLYSQAIMQENNLAQGAAVYDKAIQESITGRQALATSNPNAFMWPGNPYDTQYSHLTNSKLSISRDRQFNLVYNNAQIELIQKKYKNLLSSAQNFEIDEKQLRLTQLMTVDSSQGLYSWPMVNDPFLLTLNPTSPLGVQQVAINPVPTYDPLKGIYSSSPIPGNTDIPVTGIEQTYNPQGTVIDPELDGIAQ